MKPPLFTRAFVEGELQPLEDALRAPDAFRLRRAQYLLASACGLKPREIAAAYGGCEQNVGNVLRAFNATGVECLTPQSRRPKSARPLLAETQLAHLQHLLHPSAR